MLELVKQADPAGKWRANRFAGIVSVGNRPAIKVLAGDAVDEATTLEWNYRAITDSGLDKNLVKRQFDDAFGGTERIEWFRAMEGAC